MSDIQEVAKEKEVQMLPDPVTTKSYSVHLLISTLLLTLSLVWAVYDEVEVMRPYKDYQARFRAYYTRFLQETQPQQAAQEEQIRNSAEYQEFNAKLESEEEVIRARIAEIDKRVSSGVIDPDR